jgi:hypothetical protein
VRVLDLLRAAAIEPFWGGDRRIPKPRLEQAYKKHIVGHGSGHANQEIRIPEQIEKRSMQLLTYENITITVS